MTARKIMGFVFISFLMTACSTGVSNARTMPTAGPTRTPLVTPTQPSPESKPVSTLNENHSARSTIEAVLSRGKPYADVRDFALENGWTTVIDPNCKTNVSGTAEVCEQIPEVESCSADGYCKMNLEHAASQLKLSLFTYGDYRGWDSAESKDKLAISSWQLSSTESAITCPSQDFTAFLAAFASDKAIQNMFTQPQIAVMQFTGREMDTRLNLVPKEEYRDFSLGYKEGTFHHQNYDGTIDPMPLTVDYTKQRDRMRLNIIQEGEDYFVAYWYGTSEGNSWRFKRVGNCWSLAEDPEAPSP